MSERVCRDCVYAGANPQSFINLSFGWPATLACVNHADAPGRFRQVQYNGLCANFRARRRPAVRVEPPEPTDGDVRYIALTRGLHAAVSARDYERLKQHRWYASPSGGGKLYARRNTRRGTILMHREIMQPPPGMVVDHIDGNGLNNHRRNLRNCTPRQNEYNKPPRGRRSRFKGVYPRGGKWYAILKHKGQTYYLGTFDDEAEAARARDRKAFELEGPFAYFNFPEEFRRPAPHGGT